jgi:hypothetical protein
MSAGDLPGCRTFGQRNAHFSTGHDFKYRTLMAEIRERRRDQRFTLAIPIAVWTLLPEPFQGITRDVSTCGVYLYLELPLLAGAEITIMMRMPAQLAGHTDTVIWAHGKAVRVERLQNSAINPWGIATRIDGYTFVGEESNAARHACLSAA